MCVWCVCMCVWCVVWCVCVVRTLLVLSTSENGAFSSSSLPSSILCMLSTLFNVSLMNSVAPWLVLVCDGG